MSEHSPIGASSAHRFMACPGSVELSKHAPEQPQNVYAARGTAAHTVLEKCLYEPNNQWDYEGMEYEGGELNEEDIQAVEDAIEYIEQHPFIVMHKEVKFHIPEIHEKAFGTADIVLQDVDAPTLHVYDYKHGSGVAVEVENNKQLLFYALGAISHFKGEHLGVMEWGDIYTEVTVGIIQPRCDHPDGPFRTWKVPPDVLNKFAKDLKAACELAMTKDAPFKAGSHCRWCKAQPICGAMYERTLEVTKTDFTKKELPDAKGLSMDQIGKILEHEDLLTSWLKSVRIYAQQSLERGKKVPGFKLVKKRSNRKWIEGTTARELYCLETSLAEDAIETKVLKSPAQIEKLLTAEEKKLLTQFIHQPDNGNTIAKEDDRRQEVPAAIDEDFTVIERSQ